MIETSFNAGPKDSLRNSATSVFPVATAAKTGATLLAAGTTTTAGLKNCISARCGAERVAPPKATRTGSTIALKASTAATPSTVGECLGLRDSSFREDTCAFFDGRRSTDAGLFSVAEGCSVSATTRSSDTPEGASKDATVMAVSRAAAAGTAKDTAS